MIITYEECREEWELRYHTIRATDRLYNGRPKFRCNVYLTMKEYLCCKLCHHHLEYFSSSCMEKSSGHTFFIAPSIHIAYIISRDVLTFEVAICFPFAKTFLRIHFVLFGYA